MNTVLGFFHTKSGLAVCLLLAALGGYLLWTHTGHTLAVAIPVSSGLPSDAFRPPRTQASRRSRSRQLRVLSRLRLCRARRQTGTNPSSCSYQNGT